MALTFSNRETFLVLQWLESRPERYRYFRDLARRLAGITAETAVPRLAGAILAELELEMPKLDGLAAEMLQSGLRRVAFYELALALVLETGATASLVPTLAA
jgi:hypothetical protein